MENFVDDNDDQELVPITQLDGAWIENYFNEDAVPRGQEILSYGATYSSEGFEFLFVVSGSQINYIKEHVQSAAIGLQTTNRDDLEEDYESQDMQPLDYQIEEGARGSQEASSPVIGFALPDIEVPYDPSHENFANSYYANLLRTYPDHLLITVEHSENAKSRSGSSRWLNLKFKSELKKKGTHHFLGKFQNSVQAKARVSLGKVKLELWQWKRNNSYRIEKSILGTQISSPNSWSNSYAQNINVSDSGDSGQGGKYVKSLVIPNQGTKKCFDVSVVAQEIGKNTYTIDSNWELENSDSGKTPCFRRI